MIEGEGKMPGVDLVQEIEWLLDGAVSPLLLPSILGRSWGALEAACRRYRRQDLSRAICNAFGDVEYAGMSRQQKATETARKVQQQRLRRILDRQHGLAA